MTDPSPPTRHAVLAVEYDGAPFHGWSRQPGGLATIEQVMLDAFARLGCTQIALRCAGRTDAGVHATGQVVDARYVGQIAPEQLTRALASTLPAAVSVRSSRVAEPGFDARADATSRAYEYRILPGAAPSALRRGVVLHHPRSLDRALLDEAASRILGQHHFRAFTPARTQHVFFDRTVIESSWHERGDELVYGIRANAFLHRMVRRLVGTMLCVARGHAPIELLDELLTGRSEIGVAEAAPAHGLCLVDVTWEPIDGLPLPPGWRSARAG